MPKWISRTLLVAAGALFMLLVSFAYLNVVAPERGLDQVMHHVSAVHTEQFRREADALLGFPETAGNAVTA